MARELRLTAKQKGFVDAYFGEANGSIFRAYQIAYNRPPGGTARKDSGRTWRSPAVQQEVGRRRQALERADFKRGRDKRELLWALVDRCMQAEQVLDRRGEPTGEWRFDSAGANRALETLCKMDGEFEKDNQQKADGKLDVIVRFRKSDR